MDKKPKKIIYDIITVERFSTILNYELSTSILLFLQNYWPITLILIIFAAILFTPFMLYVLFKEKHFGWLIAFIIIVILPFIMTYFLTRDSIAFKGALIAPFLLYYGYCFIIKYSVDEWIKEYNWSRTIEEQKASKQQRIEDQIL